MRLLVLLLLIKFYLLSSICQKCRYLQSLVRYKYYNILIIIRKRKKDFNLSQDVCKRNVSSVDIDMILCLLITYHLLFSKQLV